MNSEKSFKTIVTHTWLTSIIFVFLCVVSDGEVPVC